MANAKSLKKDTKDGKRFDVKWLVVGLLLVVLLVVGIVLNNYHNTDYVARVVDSLDIDNGDLKVNWSRYNTQDIKLSDTLEITQAGIYHLTGELNDGYISVNVSADSPVKLILDNVTISNSTGPAILCRQADDLVIELVGENYLSDGAEYSADFETNVDATIFSKADTTLQGDGVLYVDGLFQDAIVSKDDLKINSGEYHITAVDDGLQGKDSVYIVCGEIAIETKGDSIKSNNDTDAGKGFIKIEGGNITIDSGDDAIHAYNNLVIDGGTINIENSYEGLEAQNIVINDGDIKVVANDDGINAGGGATTTTTAGRGMMDANPNCVVSINGGNVYVNAAGDGIDSNGYVYFNGGKVAVDGPTNNGNGALDAGSGIVMSGGDVIAVGASGMAVNLGQNSTIYNISVYFDQMQSKGAVIEIKDSSDETIISHTAAKTFSHIAAGSSKFKAGETYTLYVDGEKYQEFTILETVTTIGSGGQNQQNQQNRQNMPNMMQRR